MPSEFRFTCAIEHGLHARPASVLAEALRPFAARTVFIKESTGQSADARSVLSLVALNVALGDTCIVRADGTDADDAIAALQGVIERGFGEAAALAEAETLLAPTTTSIPAGLTRLGVRWIAGRAISPGFAHAPAVIVRSLAVTGDERATGAPEHERLRAHSALRDVRQSITEALEAAGPDLHRDLLRAHAAIADDPALRERIDVEIDRGVSAIAAVRRAGAHFADTLKASTSAYIRDRAIDVEDVCQQILERLGGASNDGSIALEQPSIIVADLLTPRQMMQLDRRLTRGLVLGRVGATSHTAILARAMGIPALVDVHDVESALADDQHIIVDAGGGFVLPEVSEDVRRYYAIERRTADRRRARLAPLAKSDARTRDRVRLEIAANVSTADEVAQAMDEGAEGVGLFRTEMLFLDRAAPPGEDEQFGAYSRAVEHAQRRRNTSIIFRTFDIGGDKPANYLRIGREDNPFLGRRGFRLYEQSANLLRNQLRGIVRASAKGKVKVMAPMVSNVRQAQWFADRVRDVQTELRKEGVRFDAKMPVGVMIEVPAAALAIDHLAKVVDFFSIGTNDLCQYFLAADRGNPQVGSLCDALEPAFLRLLKSTVDAARKHRRWIGVCGEMAGDERNLPLMVGLGVDEISVSPARVLDLKAALRDLDHLACQRLLRKAAAAARSADEVRDILLRSAGAARDSHAIIEPDLIAIDSDARSKIEAIKELTGLIVAAGRAGDMHALENAVWAREETYSTGVGHGFAIPHCKSDTVRSPTISLLKLKNPIDWGSSDGEPVRIVIMLAIPETSAAGGKADAARTHMQVLAQLARQLMHEDFRDRLMRAANPKRVVAALSICLER